MDYKTWQTHFDNRQLKEIAYCQVYATKDFRHGTDGHNTKLIIAKLIELLETVEVTPAYDPITNKIACPQ